MGDPEENHMTTRQQNMACLASLWPELNLNQQWWDYLPLNFALNIIAETPNKYWTTSFHNPNKGSSN